MDRIIIIAGATAVGKTEYSIEIAKTIGGEIISCDSMQLYKFMDIGSAKVRMGLSSRGLRAARSQAPSADVSSSVTVSAGVIGRPV